MFQEIEGEGLWSEMMEATRTKAKEAMAKKEAEAAAQDKPEEAGPAQWPPTAPASTPKVGSAVPKSDGLCFVCLYAGPMWGHFGNG